MARTRRPKQRRKQPSNTHKRDLREGGRRFLQRWLDAFDEHRILAYATAVAMRALIASIALTLLILALIGATGHESIWNDHVAPALEPKLTHATYIAINTAVQKIFAADSTGLIVFASLYAIWQVSGGLRAVMDALNTIVDADDDRSAPTRWAISCGLAVPVIVLIVLALFVVGVAGRLLASSGGVLHWLIAVLRWPIGAIFLGLAVAMVARYAPVKRRGTRWASVGAIVIVLGWLVASALYAWFISVSTFKTASSNLLLVVFVTTYFYVSSIVFLVGAQLDEFLREARGGNDHLTLREFLRGGGS